MSVMLLLIQEAPRGMGPSLSPQQYQRRYLDNRIPCHVGTVLTSFQKPDAEYQKKRQTFITRTIWTFVMIAGFFISMFSGHIYIIGIVTAVQIVSFKEVIAIANVPSKEKNIRFTKSLNWYFLGTSMYFLYGESVIYYFKHILLVDRVLLPLATHHRFISFTLWIMGT